MKRGVVVSDIHAGSIYGMLPPHFETFEGLHREQLVWQVYLWKCWLNFVERAARWQPDFVIVNGDVVDGMQKKNEGSELALPDHRDQQLAGSITLKVLKERVPNRCKWYFTQGTPYHVGHFGDAEENIAEALGGQKYPSVGTGRLCREALWLDVDGVLIEAAHHISVSTGFYRMTSLDREGQWSAMSAKDSSKGIPKTDLLIRSHVHYFGRTEHASKEIVTTPCWQLQTRYMRKNSLHRMLPDIGGLLVEVNPEAKERGESPCQIRKELYALPAVPVVKL